MTIFISRALPLWLMLLAIIVCQQAGSGSGAKDSGAPRLCHQELMQSYLLKGTEFSNNRTMLLCPTIKRNCCTRHDIQRIFHFTRDVLPPRVAEYRQKVDILLYQLREIHNQLIGDRPTFVGRRSRRNFCARQYRNFTAIDFNQIYTGLQQELMHSEHWTIQHSQRFFCMMCDGDAHENIIIRPERRAVSFNLDYCQDSLKENKNLLKLLNIELVKYIRTVQNVVDCVHYSRSFGLRFPRPDKTQLMNGMVTCIEGMDGSRFKVACQNICQQIKFGQIVPLIDGDVDFLQEIVLVFNRFLRYKESGNVISMRLRGFFKRFRIPRRLTRSRRKNFFKNLVSRPPKQTGKKHERSLRLISSPRKLIDSSAHKRPVKSQKAAIMAQSGSQAEASLKAGRFLQNFENVSSINQPRKVNYTPLPKNVPAPSFDKTLREFYTEVEIPRIDTPRETVYRIRGPPIFFPRFEMNWIEDGGISYEYYNPTRFNMSRRTLNRLLYSYRKPEMPDTKLTMFLMDFTTDFFKQSGAIFNADYTIMPNNYLSKFTSDLEIEDLRRRRRLAKLEKKSFPGRAAASGLGFRNKPNV